MGGVSRLPTRLLHMHRRTEGNVKVYERTMRGWYAPQMQVVVETKGVAACLAMVEGRKYQTKERSLNDFVDFLFCFHHEFVALDIELEFYSKWALFLS